MIETLINIRIRIQRGETRKWYPDWELNWRFLISLSHPFTAMTPSRVLLKRGHINAKRKETDENLRFSDTSSEQVNVIHTGINLSKSGSLLRRMISHVIKGLSTGETTVLSPIIIWWKAWKKISQSLLVSSVIILHVVTKCTQQVH